MDPSGNSYLTSITLAGRFFWICVMCSTSVTHIVCLLVHPWKCFSPTKIINKEIILESIYLNRNISMISFNNTVLELI